MKRSNGVPPQIERSQLDYKKVDELTFLVFAAPEILKSHIENVRIERPTFVPVSPLTNNTYLRTLATFFQTDYEEKDSGKKKPNNFLR